MREKAPETAKATRTPFRPREQALPGSLPDADAADAAVVAAARARQERKRLRGLNRRPRALLVARARHRPPRRLRFEDW
ncbi:MAG: hypothetical protein HY900_18420 [Deltaproteobacteria bacterium]|nr:hypothetical protein [Deltaproteobacteria bacterium]